MSDNINFENAVCFLCEKHDNPCVDHDGTRDNPQNFIHYPEYAGTDEEYVHRECEYLENNRYCL